MRIIVFSDTHGDTASCVRAVEKLIGIDMIIHAGDTASDAVFLAEKFPDIPVKFVVGNCDFNRFPSDITVEAEGKRIFVTHGHRYNVKNELSHSSLMEKAQAENCDCAVYGHTHISSCSTDRGIVLLNPGSIRYGKTFGIIEIENGTLKACVCEL